MFDKSTCKSLRDQIDEALAEVGRRNNVSISAGNARFTPTTITFKLNVIANGENGEVVDEFVDAWNIKHRLYGFLAEDLGKKFTAQGTVFTVHGLAPRAKKYPVVCKDASGKMYKFATGEVKARIAGI